MFRLIVKSSSGPYIHNTDPWILCNGITQNPRICILYIEPWRWLYNKLKHITQYPRICILYIGAWRWLYDKSKHVAHIVCKYNKYRCVRRSILDFIILLLMLQHSGMANTEIKNEKVSLNLLFINQILYFVAIERITATIKLAVICDASY